VAGGLQPMDVASLVVLVAGYRHELGPGVFRPDLDVGIGAADREQFPVFC